MTLYFSSSNARLIPKTTLSVYFCWHSDLLFLTEGYNFFFPFYTIKLEPHVDEDVCHLLVNAFLEKF